MQAEIDQIPLVYQRILRLAERNPRRAAPIAQRLFATTKNHPLPTGAWSHYTLGFVLLLWERIPQAEEHLLLAHTMLADLGDTPLALRCCRALMIVRMLASPEAEMLPEWDNLAASWDAAGLPLEAARTRIQQMFHLNSLVRSQEARALAEQVTPIIQAYGTPYDQGLLLRARAGSAAGQGQTHEALVHINQAALLFAQLQNHREVAICWFSRAWIHHRREQFDAAQADLKRAQRVFQRLDMLLHLALCERNSGIAMSRTGRYDQALMHALRAHQQFQAIGRQIAVADCDLILGNVSYYVGLYRQAQTSYQRAQDTYSKLGSHHLSMLCQRNQAMVLQAQGKPQEALAMLERLEHRLRMDGDALELAEVMHTKGRVLADLSEYDAALSYLVAAQQQFDTHGNSGGAAESLMQQAWIHLLEKDDPTSAEQLFQTAAPHLSECPNHAWRVAYGLARCALTRGDTASAQRWYHSALAIVAQLRRTLASEYASSGLSIQSRRLYEDALQFATNQRDESTVLLLAEQQRSLTLQRHIHQAVQERLEASCPPQTISTQQRLSLQHLLTSYRQEPSSFEREVDAYIDILLRLHHSAPLPDSLPPELCSLPTIRQHLDATYPDGWLALVYAHGGDDLLLITVESHTIACERIPFDASLKQLLKSLCAPDYRDFLHRDFRQLYEQRECPPWSLLTELGERLLPQQVYERLHPALRLLIVSSGPLHAVPWAAVRVSERWLCENAIIQLLPALSLWQTFASQTSSAHAALLVGCSHFGERARPLAQVHAELNMVTDHWEGAITRLEDEHATRQNMLDMAFRGEFAHYHLIHIASHAHLVGSQGLLAHLKLWDDDMFLDEISGLGLKGAIVVLATCHGATSEVLPGDEVLSLSYAFLAAGARSVVACLWPLYDGIVQELLTVFYDALARQCDAPTALALAQRHVLAQAGQRTGKPEIQSAPLIWGGLHLFGA